MFARRPSRLLAIACTVVATGAIGGTATARPHPDGPTVARLVPPANGQAFFGLTFRLFDTPDPLWGDSRSFDERIRDSIAVELAGKRPCFVRVWTPWQRPDLPGKPLVRFDEALGDIAKVRSVTGDEGVLHLDWNLTLTTVPNGGSRRGTSRSADTTGTSAHTQRTCATMRGRC